MSLCSQRLSNSTIHKSLLRLLPVSSAFQVLDQEDLSRSNRGRVGSNGAPLAHGCKVQRFNESDRITRFATQMLLRAREHGVGGDGRRGRTAGGAAIRGHGGNDNNEQLYGDEKYHTQWMEATIDGMGATKKRVRLVHW